MALDPIVALGPGIIMNEYQREQWDALEQLQKTITRFSKARKQRILLAIEPYLDFRRRLDHFSQEHFNAHCTSACFQSKRSACCSKDGIITFWADMVVNTCCCGPAQMALLHEAIQKPHFSDKCIYLVPGGCLWSVRPLVCAMFICDRVQDAVLGASAVNLKRWNTLKSCAKSFRWPDKPVLFDYLETVFIAAGCDSSLMYLHKSPGLLRIKKKAGLI